MLILISLVLAFTLDRLVGEFKRFHPLVGFGVMANGLEKQFNDSELKPNESSLTVRIKGIIAWFIAVIPMTLVIFWVDKYLVNTDLSKVFFYSFIVYLAIGWRSLWEHAMAIAKPLKDDDLTSARHALSMIVSRETSELNEKEISKAATESVLENGADAIFCAIFWFIVAGAPGVVFYRLSNTLDAMWGYKNKQFIYFGWFSARMDDVLNYIPARLTSMSYCVMGNTKQALHCWGAQGNHWKSPNAGPVMASGAGALNVSLGGGAKYHGKFEHRPLLGPIETTETLASYKSIFSACELVEKSILLWLFCWLSIWLLIVNC